MARVEELVSYQRCTERMQRAWSGFCERRRLRLRERERYGHAAERATEEILEDLLTNVLDWSVGDLNHQVGYADLLLTRLGIKYLIIEAKKPGSLAWSRPSVERALEQASRYASEQRVQSVAVSDGHMLYAADIVNGGMRDRTFIPLDCAECESDLWWLSINGIYRLPGGGEEARLQILGEADATRAAALVDSQGEVLLHPKYRLPASCFAFVGDPRKPGTWALPYRREDGTIDAKRLPKAIQAVISNYRGAQVSRVPEKEVADVLVRLGRAAATAGKMPWQVPAAAPVYSQLELVINQLSRLDEVKGVDC